MTLLCAPASMQARTRHHGGRKAKTEKADTTEVKSKYEKLFDSEKSCEPGMFTVHQTGGKVYFEVPKTLMGREFLMGSTVRSISDNGNGLVGGKSMDGLRHFTLTQVDTTVQMRIIDDTYVSDDPNISRALSRSHVAGIMRAFKVEAQSPDSSAVVIDATPLFLEEDKEMSPFTGSSTYSSYERTETYKKDLSYIVGARAFEDNVSVTSSMSYTYTLKNSAGKTVVKNQPFTAELTRSIVLLPEEIYHPRTADYRIGYFWTTRQAQGSMSKPSSTVYLVNRWRLEPSDTAAYRRGELVEPVKPVTFYIDSDFPEWWKPYIREAVEQWNEPFEAIGFRNAVVARFFPDPQEDPDFDPDNIKYSCIRYAPVGIQNAMGPSWTDPRSGEIICASVYVYHDVISLLKRWLFVQTGQADERVRTNDIPREILGDGLRYVISHEVGHCLGLMHNMSASSCIPVESLRDPEFTGEHGTTYSIMDYARFNYVAQPGDMERGVKMTPPRFGSYDKYAIRWAYTPVFDAEDFDEETRITEKWITDSLQADSWYRYGKQQVMLMFFDPSCQTEDLGDDVLKATAYGVSNLKYIASNFMEWAADGDEDFTERTELYKTIINQYLTYAGHVARNVAGLYTREVKDGDPFPRFANVPRERQKQCLKYLEGMWEDVSWLGDRSIVDRLPIVGTPEQAVRKAIEQQIFLMPFLAGCSDGVATVEYPTSDVMDDIWDMVWSPTAGRMKLTAAQRSLQTNYVSSMMTTANFKAPGGSSALVDVAPDASPIVAHAPGCFDSHADMCGEVTYSPVSGFEWMPRMVFSLNSLNQPMIYSALMAARDAMKKAIPSASEEDRAHYQVLVRTIEFSLER